MPGPPVPGPPGPMLDGSTTPIPRGPQSPVGGIPRALLTLPCTMNEFAALWLRSAMSSFLIVPSLSSAAVVEDWFTLSR